MDNKSLTERDICTKFITPAIKRAGWDEMAQIREEVFFTKGQIKVRGKLVTRDKRKFADYVLYCRPNIPLVLIEAMDNNHAVRDGMQQALGYAESPMSPSCSRRMATALYFTIEPAVVRRPKLTILTQELNSSVSNSAWLAKKPDLLRSSLLPINQELRGYDSWDEEAIENRGNELFQKACTVWPAPNPPLVVRVSGSA